MRYRKTSKVYKSWEKLRNDMKSWEKLGNVEKRWLDFRRDVGLDFGFIAGSHEMTVWPKKQNW